MLGRTLIAYLLLVSVAYCQDFGPIFCKYEVRGPVIALTMTADEDTLIQFSEYVRELDNPKWKSDPVAVLRQASMVKQIKKEQCITTRLTPESEEPEEIAAVKASNKKFQKAIDNYKGKFVVINPLPTVR